MLNGKMGTMQIEAFLGES
uniref:Uncharacterized protein n=1 Tax=Rhizophora mucronata TaxID=61149 RepID=A0A2P2J1D7_RHIMU